MYRLYSEQKPAWLHQGSEFRVIRRYAPVLWESQIAFRNDSDQLYSEGEQTLILLVFDVVMMTFWGCACSAVVLWRLTLCST